MKQDIDSFIKSANDLIQTLQEEKNLIIEEYYKIFADLKEAEKTGKRIKVCFIKDITFPIEKGGWQLNINNYLHTASFASLSIHFNKVVYIDQSEWFDNPLQSFAWSQCEIVDNPKGDRLKFPENSYRNYPTV